MTDTVSGLRTSLVHFLSAILFALSWSFNLNQTLVQHNASISILPFLPKSTNCDLLNANLYKLVAKKHRIAPINLVEYP